MSNKNQETIADIVFAMRNEGHTGEASCLEWIRAKMTYYADRIEAAWKREREAGPCRVGVCKRDGECEKCNEYGTIRRYAARDTDRIHELRALVKEMADELSKFHAWKEARALVAKAREEVSNGQGLHGAGDALCGGLARSVGR